MLSPRRSPALLLAAGLVVASTAGCPREAPPPFDPAADCPQVLADPTLPTDATDAARRREAGQTWSDGEVRAVYVCRVRGIAGADVAWRAEGLDAESRARRAFAIRHGARLTGRAMMSSRAEVAALEARDRLTYGDRDGPSWAWLVERGRAKGLAGDALYDSIRQGAAETNDTMDAHFGL